MNNNFLQNQDKILILNLDGINSLVARKIRDLNVYCLVMPYDTNINKIKELKPKGIIYTGSYNMSQSELDSIDFGAILNVLDLNIHVFGYNRTINKNFDLNVATINTLVMIDDEQLESFVFSLCNCSPDWKTDSFIENTIAEIKGQVGDGKVLCGLSGGVDSCVTAALVNKAVGKNLVCIFVDHGLMRKDEGKEVFNTFKNNFDIDIITVNAQERFYKRLKGVINPEGKRKIIGEEFIRVFEEEAKKLGEFDYFAQGTIYPDIIESGDKKSKGIKSHHNVGGLPEVINFKGLVEPLKDLFKDEVRKVGISLGLHKSLVYRQPFPGPGLGVRCIGEITPEKAHILREADFIFRDEIAKAGLDKDIWQFFAVLTDTRSVGMTNGERTYGYTVALRAINTIDAMTADWVRIDFEVLASVSERIVREVDDVNRVVYDITNKPPGTIEWE